MINFAKKFFDNEIIDTPKKTYAKYSNINEDLIKGKQLQSRRKQLINSLAENTKLIEGYSNSSKLAILDKNNFKETGNDLTNMQRDTTSLSTILKTTINNFIKERSFVKDCKNTCKKNLTTEEEENRARVTNASGGFNVMRGNCSIDSDKCVVSPHYPNNYGNSQTCKIKMEDKGKLQVRAFNSEPCCDSLTIKGRTYKGTNGPDNVRVKKGDVLSWRSDHSVTRSGFKICLKPDNTNAIENEKACLAGCDLSKVYLKKTDPSSIGIKGEKINTCEDLEDDGPQYCNYFVETENCRGDEGYDRTIGRRGANGKQCNTNIPANTSGVCICKDGTVKAQVDCGHTNFSCNEVCQPEGLPYTYVKPVDCKMSGFTEWSACSRSCGVGKSVRTRFPEVLPRGGGKSCPVNTETKDCENKACPPENFWERIYGTILADLGQPTREGFTGKEGFGRYNNKDPNLTRHIDSVKDLANTCLETKKTTTKKMGDAAYLTNDYTRHVNQEKIVNKKAQQLQGRINSIISAKRNLWDLNDSSSQELMDELASYQKEYKMLKKLKMGTTTLNGMEEDGKLKEKSAHTKYLVWLSLAICTLIIVIKQLK